MTIDHNVVETERWINEQEQPCNICRSFDCNCPECEVCGVAGDPACINTHMSWSRWPALSGLTPDAADSDPCPGTWDYWASVTSKNAAGNESR